MNSFPWVWNEFLTTDKCQLRDTAKIFSENFLRNWTQALLLWQGVSEQTQCGSVLPLLMKLGERFLEEENWTWNCCAHTKSLSQHFKRILFILGRITGAFSFCLLSGSLRILVVCLLALHCGLVFFSLYLALWCYFRWPHVSTYTIWIWRYSVIEWMQKEPHARAGWYPQDSPFFSCFLPWVNFARSRTLSSAATENSFHKK